jgi:hypothetical protein
MRRSRPLPPRPSRAARALALGFALVAVLAASASVRAQPGDAQPEPDAPRLGGEGGEGEEGEQREQGEEAPAPGRSAQELAARLAEAEDAWFFGSYPEVVRILSPLLVPTPDPNLAHDQLLRGYELLGASLHFQFGPDRSEPAFVALLYLEPDHDLDPFVFPESMRRYLDNLRDALRVELEAIRRERRRGVYSGQLFVGRTVERRSLVVSMLPFGIGHFLNGERGWGTFYLVTELLLGGVSMGMYMANEVARGDDGYFDDVGPAETRQLIQVGTGVAFFVVLVANIAHGAVVHQDVIETRYEILDGPPEDFLGPSSSAPPPIRGVWGGPTPDGWVVGFGWSF